MTRREEAPLSMEARSAFKKGSHVLEYEGVHHLPSMGGTEEKEK